MKNKIDNEKRIVETMIHIYCNSHHKKTGETLCRECEELKNYAFSKLQTCKFGNQKTSCKKCPIHCYKPVMRTRIKKVMRYAGPRIIWKHPLLTILHLIY